LFCWTVHNKLENDLETSNKISKSVYGPQCVPAVIGVLVGCFHNKIVAVWRQNQKKWLGALAVWIQMIYSQGRGESGHDEKRRHNVLISKGMPHNGLLTPGSRPPLSTSFVCSFAVLRALKSQAPSRNPQYCIVGHKHDA